MYLYGLEICKADRYTLRSDRERRRMRERDKDARRWATRPIASCPSHPCGGVSHYCCDLVVAVVPVGRMQDHDPGRRSRPFHVRGGTNYARGVTWVGLLPLQLMVLPLQLMVMLLQLLVTPARRPDPVLGRPVPRPTVGIVGALEVEAGPMVGGDNQDPIIHI